MNQEKIGKYIKYIRKKNNLTQKQLAEKLHVTYQAVSKWENGKNIPDIEILKQICEIYNIDINEFLNGKKCLEKFNKKFLLILIPIFIIFIGCIFLFLFKDNSFEFKTISSNCNNFNISGSIAYNNTKSSIYISHIDYCGDDDKKVYQEINCTLYEVNGKIKNKIDNCNNKNNQEITLEEFLKNVRFNINDYAKTCKEYNKNSLYLEINAKKVNGTISKFKIPLKLEKNCY